MRHNCHHVLMVWSYPKIKGKVDLGLSSSFSNTGFGGSKELHCISTNSIPQFENETDCSFVKISDNITKRFGFDLIEGISMIDDPLYNELPQYLRINSGLGTTFDSDMADCLILILKHLVYVFQVVSYMTC